MEIRLCLFHLTQSIHRHINTHGLSSLYRKSQEYRKVVRSLGALTFLPEEDVIFGFEVLIEEYGRLDLDSYLNDMENEYQAQLAAAQVSRNALASRANSQSTQSCPAVPQAFRYTSPNRSQNSPNRSQNSPSRSQGRTGRRRVTGPVVDPFSVFTYFEKLDRTFLCLLNISFRYYIGSDERAATFPINTWTAYETELEGSLGRTNNAQESFHKSINKQFSGSHPKLSKYG